MRGTLLPGAPWLEVTVAATAVASAMVGLAISALVDNADKTMPPLVVLVMAQLVFTGALLSLAGKPGIEQVAWLFPGRWGYAAAAAVSDLNTLQQAGSNPGVTADPLWRHAAATYLTDLGGLTACGLAGLLVTGLLLRRLDPRSRRRGR